MTLSKNWSLREGGENRSSKSIGIDGLLFSEKMTVTGGTSLSVEGVSFSLQGLDPGKHAEHNVRRLAISLVLIYWGVTLRIKK